MNRTALIPYDQRIARTFVRPLANTFVTPNMITALTAILAIAGALMIATGDRVWMHWGAGVFVLARFLDHFDGELARLQGTSSRLGYYLDYAAGAGGYTALFICLGIGHWIQGNLGLWALLLGAAGAASVLISTFVNLRIDEARVSAEAGNPNGGDSVGYPALGGFELEDGMYLLAPITWLGWLLPFFVAAGIGAAIYCLWTVASFRRLRPRM